MFKTIVISAICGLTICGSLFSQGDSKSQIALKYIQKEALLAPGMSISENLQISDEYTSQGVTHIYFQQTLDNIPIFNKITGIHINKENKAFHVSNSFVNVKSPNSLSRTNLITVPQALQQVANHFDLNLRSTLLVSEKPNSPTQESKWMDEGLSKEEIPVKLIYDFNESGKLVLCWDIAVLKPDDSFYWDVRINANDGSYVTKNSWTHECNWGHSHNHVEASEKPKHDHSRCIAKAKSQALVNESYNVYALPLIGPDDGARSIEVAPWNNALNASPFGWHDTDGVAGAEFTIARGNNVYATEDRNANNVPGFSPEGTANLEFDFPIDLTDSPVDYQEAAITNLFYWNNIIHDVMYQYGFDEPSGNFQQNNYGNGGIGSDAVAADAQDGSSTNNANFSTPADGGAPRMQMFEWVGSAIDFQVNTPLPVSGSYFATGASFGPTSGTVTGTVIIADDGTGAPTEACNALVNGAAMNGNIALIDRGNCPFVDKVQNAQDAGATGVIICNNDNSALITMGGNTGSITIPSIMISLGDCATLRNTLLPLNVTIGLPSNPNRDSDLDNLIIAHEYGHGISTRLTGGPAAAGCLGNDEQMGEGWSDYFGLILTMKPSDLATDAKSVGTYVQFQPQSGPGIRPFPYSTDFAINPHTYNDIGSESIPHGLGSVWTAMLWEMTWDLIAVYGFDTDFYNGTGGNNIALQLVMDGLKLQGCSPGFVDGRDAILLADQMNNAGANQCLIWEAFARRGLGFSASQGSSASATDGSEAFDTPASCQAVVMIEKTAAATTNAGDILTYTIEITNNQLSTVANIDVTDILPAGTTLVPGSLSCGTESGGVVTINLTNVPAGTITTCTFDVTTATNNFTVVNFADDIESGVANWALNSNQGTGVWTTSNANPFMGTTSWFVPNEPADNTQFLESVTIPAGASPLLSFYHSYDTEAGWDGGYIEVSTNGGASWSTISSADIILNPYNGTLGASSNNDIANEPAFTGNSNGYINTQVDLSAYANQSINIRFVFGSDDNTTSVGWYIDEVTLFDAVFVTNEACFTSSVGDADCSEVTTMIFEPLVNNCQNSLTYTNEVIPNATDEHLNQFIETVGTVTINSGSAVELAAGDYVLMNAGFEIFQGAEVHIYIGPCN